MVKTSLRGRKSSLAAKVQRRPFSNRSTALSPAPPETPIPRPRGRPRKTTTESEAQPAQAAKRPRGRPPGKSSAKSPASTAPASANNDQGRAKKKVSSDEVGWEECTLQQEKLLNGAPAQVDDDVFVGLPSYNGPPCAAVNIPRNCTTLFDYFRLFYTDEIMNTFVTQTNNYGRKSLNKWKDTSIDELFRLFAIIFYMGLVRQPTIRSYWSTRNHRSWLFYGNNFVPLVMSLQRFETLMAAFHYIDVVDRTTQSAQSSAPVDPLALVNPFLKKLASNYSHYSQCGQFMDIDEMCIKFKGRHKLRQYNAKKPNKWHFKVYCLNNSDGYLQDFIMFEGGFSNRDDDIAASLHPINVLTKDPKFHGKNHILCIDNWYTSVEALELCIKRRIQCVGTLRRNRKKIPTSRLFPLTRGKKRGEIECFRKQYGKHAIFMTAWQDNRPVHFLSTYKPWKAHVKRWVKVKNLPSMRKVVSAPSIVKHYAFGMKGTDLLDQYTSYYLFDRKSKKWTRRIFNHFLLISVSNANILRFRKTGKKVSLRQAIENLIVELCPGSFTNYAEEVDLVADDDISTISSTCSNEPPAKKYRVDDSSVSTLGSSVIKESFHCPIKIATHPGADRSCVRRQCGHCKKRTMIFCSACELPLCVDEPGPDNCFSLFHRKHFHLYSTYSNIEANDLLTP